MSRARILCAVLVCAALLPALRAHGQDRVGAVAGVNIARLVFGGYYYYDSPYYYDNSGTTSDAYTGLLGGICYDHRLDETYSFYTEVYYVRRGGKYTISRQSGPVNQITTSYRSEYDYIAIPLSVRMRMPEGVVHPYGTFGFILSWNVRAKSFTDNDPDNPEVDWKQYTRTFNSLLQICMGLEVPVSKTVSLSADFRYARSLANIDKSANKVYSSDMMIVTGVLINAWGGH